MDTAAFWTKVELKDGKLGFLKSTLCLDSHDRLTMVCPKLVMRNIFGLPRENRLPKGSVITFAFQDDSNFELWSGELTNVRDASNRCDEYTVHGMNLELECSERAFERYLVTVPMLLSDGKHTWRFAGGELSETGIGLWLPAKCCSRVLFGERYELCFKPREVEPFKFTIECSRPHVLDDLSNGAVMGFRILDANPNELPATRLRQLIQARGRLRNPVDNTIGHYLKTFWEGEVRR